jgi:hypothetical protein
VENHSGNPEDYVNDCTAKVVTKWLT